MQNCSDPPGDGFVSRIVIHGGDEIQPRMVEHAEELFRLGADDSAALRFDPIADADENGDGTITFEELAKVPAPPVEGDAGVAPPEEDDAKIDAGTNNLAGRIYETLLPRTVRLADGGACQAEARPPRRF
jgi:hypothetical protein